MNKKTHIKVKRAKLLKIVAIFIAFILLPSIAEANQTVNKADTLSKQEIKNITINVKDATIKKIFYEIQKQTKLNFVYEDQQLKSLGAKTINVKNATISSILDNLLAGSDLTYVVKGRTVMITKKTTKPAIGKMLSVTGKVVDSQNKPIAGATIILLGTTKGAISGENGSFSLNANVSQDIEVTYVGMKPTIKRLSDSNKPLVITLQEDILNVDEVVITGVFNKPKESYTGAVTFISKKELQNFKSRNLLKTINNIDPAFNIVENNTLGSNPNALPEINIRGMTNLPSTDAISNITDINNFQTEQRANLNTPLFILDGFEITLERMMDLDEDEVENVTILKDAGSTAIYGSRGSNGVVVITSTKPQAGKLRVNFRAGLNIELPDLTSYDVLNAREKLELESMAGLFIAKPDAENPLQVLESQRRLDLEYNSKLRSVLEGVDTYWLSQPLETGISGNYGLSLSGGDRSFRYSLNTSYRTEKGVMKGSDRNNFNGSLNISYLYKSLQFSNTVSVGLNKSNDTDYGSFSEYTRLNPYLSPHDKDGNIAIKFDTKDYSVDIYNPLYNATTSSYKNQGYTNLSNNTSLEWSPVKTLKLGARIGFNQQTREGHNYKSATNSDFYNELDQNKKGRYDYTSGKNHSFDINATASYAEVFGKHSIFCGVNASINEGKSVSYSFSAQGYTHERLDFISMGSNYIGNVPGGSESSRRGVGLTANINYNWNHALFVDGSYRVDGASSFGSYSRFKPFYTVGAGWTASSLKFIKEKVKAINTLRFKYNYGITGSLPFQVYDALTTFSYNVAKRYDDKIGATVMGYGNPNLTWQYTYTHNIGMDLTMLNGRLSIGANYYDKLTKGSITKVNLPLSHGFDNYTENKGDINNYGYDLNISYKIINNNKRQINWSVRASFTQNNNKLVKLSKAMKEYSENIANRNNSNDQVPFMLYREGESMNALYVVPSLGIDPATGNELFLKRDGSVSFTYSPLDKVAAGLDQPKITGSISSSLSYKGFNLNVSFGLRLGGQLYNSTLVSKVENADIRYNVDRRVFSERWNGVNHYAKYKGLTSVSATAPHSSRFMQDESTLKCNTLSASYNLTGKWLKDNFKVTSMNIDISTSDLFQISTVKLERGISYPFSRKITLQLSLTF